MPSPRPNKPARPPSQRYAGDVLAAERTRRPEAERQELAVGLVVEDPTSGFCGAVTRWENGLVVLEDRHGKRRSFPVGPGFWIDGRPVVLTHPAPRHRTPTRSASGSVSGPAERARIARAGRIYVEGRHDAELVEKVWGDDLRHVGVVIEYLGGVDDLPAVVDEFRPGPGRRLGVLVDHLVPGSKESRIAAEAAGGAYGAHLLVTGHPFIDIWSAIKPARVGIERWPEVPRGEDWKSGICARLGWPHDTQADVARTWRGLLDRVRRWTDLETPLLTEVERLIDFVTDEN